MELIDVVKVLHELRKTCIDHRLESGDSIVYGFKSRTEVEKTLDGSSIIYDKIGKSEISINISRYPGLFYNGEHFLQNSERFLQQQCNIDTLKSNIGILFYLEDKYLYYESTNGNTYVGLELDPSDFFIQNTYYYWKFYQHFRSLDISEYHSSANREFILISPENGKFLLGYPSIPPSFQKELSISNKYSALNKINQSQEFRCFIKEQIIDFLSSFVHDERFPKFIENVETIIEMSENNYEVFLRKFDFDELKKNFRKERDEYFSNIRDIVDQLLGKVVSIPISVSAAALAIYNLRKEPNYAIIVVIAFIIYSLFASFLLRLLHFDTFEIKQDLESDIKIIKTSSNIPESILNEETSKVYKKIYLLNKTIITLQLIFAILSLAVLIVFFQIFTIPYKWVALILTFVLDLQLLIFFWRLGNRRFHISS